MYDNKLHSQHHYRVDTKEENETARQNGNNPIKDGFFRRPMVMHQPSESLAMEGDAEYQWEHENVDIERTR